MWKKDFRHAVKFLLQQFIVINLALTRFDNFLMDLTRIHLEDVRLSTTRESRVGRVKRFNFKGKGELILLLS